MTNLTPPSTTSPAVNPVARLGGLAGGVVGWYAGLNLLVPVVGGLALAFAAKAALPADRKPFLPAIAIVGGHACWFVVGALVVGGWGPVALDLTLLAVSLLWLSAAPGLGPVLLLCAYEVMALVVNGLAISEKAFRSMEHKALTAHLLLSALGGAAAITGWLAWRKAASAEAAPAV